MLQEKIGVFDSGVGGLLVLQDLMRHYPHESFVYLADAGNSPYGTKSQEALQEIVEKNIAYLESLGVKGIIIACNTASVVSVAKKPSVPMIRIVEPTVIQALAKGGRIAILATNFTIASRTYQFLLGKDAIGVPCSDFVPLVESGQYHSDLAMTIVKEKLKDLIGKVDTVVLGCTHFGLLEEVIRKVLGDVAIVDSALSIAPILGDSIPLNQDSNKKTHTALLTTGKLADLQMDWFQEKMDEKREVKI